LRFLIAVLHPDFLAFFLKLLQEFGIFPGLRFHLAMPDTVQVSCFAFSPAEFRAGACVSDAAFQPGPKLAEPATSSIASKRF
jgi:hypothetical protein